MRKIPFTRTILCVAALSLKVTAVAAPGDHPDAAAVVALLQAQDEAILRVGERLVVSGRPFCPESGHSTGMTVQLLSRYGANFRAAAAATLGVGDLPTVTAVAAGSAALSAGLRVGDRIAAIDGHVFRSQPAVRGSGDFGPTSAALDAIEAVLADGSARLDVVRGSERRTVTLTPRRACRARFDVRAGTSSNASSDGTYVQVASDLVAEARDDEELAAILAHELVHNILRHPQRLKGPAPRPTVLQTEIEADRLSAYLLDAAGYTTAGAERFWGRWGKARDLGIFSAGTHPRWKQRIAIFRAETAKIAAMKQAGRPVTAPSDLQPRR